MPSDPGAAWLGWALAPVAVTATLALGAVSVRANPPSSRASGALSDRGACPLGKGLPRRIGTAFRIAPSDAPGLDQDGTSRSASVNLSVTPPGGTSPGQGRPADPLALGRAIEGVSRGMVRRRPPPSEMLEP